MNNNLSVSHMTAVIFILEDLKDKSLTCFG